MLFVDEDGGVKVAVGGGTWTFNPLCLAPANKDSSQKVRIPVHVFHTVHNHYIHSLTLVTWFAYWMMLMKCAACKKVMESGLMRCQKYVSWTLVLISKIIHDIL